MRLFVPPRRFCVALWAAFSIAFHTAFYTAFCGALVVLFATLGNVQASPVSALCTNAFNDPFFHATSVLPQCPVPEGPFYAAAEVRERAHARAARPL